MEICLHLGAHKTATTYLQLRLRRNRRALSMAGVEAVPLKLLRAEVSARLGEAPLAARDGLARLVAAAERSGVQRLILSDENLIGTCASVLDDGALYRDAGARIARLGPALDGALVTLAFAVRGRAAFLASAWGQRLRAGFHRPFDRLLKAPFLAGGRGWSDLVADILDALPSATMVLWRFEDFADTEPLVIGALAGSGAGSGAAQVAPIAERPLPGPSAAAVAEIEAAVAAGHSEPGAGAWRRLPEGVAQDVLSRLPKGADRPAFDPWSAAERATLAEHDADDLLRLAGLDRVALLDASDRAAEPVAPLAPRAAHR